MSFDDRLRDLFHTSIETPEVPDPDALADELIDKYETSSPGGGGGGPAPLGGGAFWWVAGIAVIVGIGVGLLLATTRTAEEPTGSVLSLEGVPVYVCPGEGQVGTLYRGDEILIVGRSSDGRWLAVRNVRGASETVYIESVSVLADSDTVDLPERDCEFDGVVAVGSPDTTTTTLPIESTTAIPSETTVTTDVSEPTEPTQPPATQPTTPPTVPDTQAPSITQAVVNPGEIWEQDGLGYVCPAGTPRQATMSAVVTDDRALAAVTASWTVAGSGQQRTMSNSGGNTWTGIFGPFPALTIPNTNPFQVGVNLTIQATDGSGNSRQQTLMATLNSAGLCIG